MMKLTGATKKKDDNNNNDKPKKTAYATSVITRVEVLPQNIEIDKQYYVDDSRRTQVTITKDGRYLVTEPRLTKQGERAYRHMMDAIQQTFKTSDVDAPSATDQKIENEEERELTDSDLSLTGGHQASADALGNKNKKSIDRYLALINQYVEREAKHNADEWEAWQRENHIINHYVRRNIGGWDVLDPLLNDEDIEDILVLRYDQPVQIVHRKYHEYPLMPTNITFRNQEHLASFIQKMAQKHGGKSPSEHTPQTSFETTEAVRMTVTGNTRITPDSPTISIRKPSKKPITLKDVLKSKTLSPLAMAYLWCCIDLKQFGIMMGSPGTGKTSLINALFMAGNPRWHYFMIEDILEIRLEHDNVSRHQPTITSLESQGTEQKEGEVTVFDLCKLSLRFRPDYVIVGEVLGPEMRQVMQVAASGSGCMTSFHASDPMAALYKLKGDPFNISTQQIGQIGFLLDIKWQVTPSGDRERRVTKIVEPQALTDADVEAGVVSAEDKQRRFNVKDIFTYSTSTDTLEPYTARELVERSNVIKQIAFVLNKPDPVEDLELRMSILNNVLNDPKIQNDPKRIFEYIKSYYY